MNLSDIIRDPADVQPPRDGGPFNDTLMRRRFASRPETFLTMVCVAMPAMGDPLTTIGLAEHPVTDAMGHLSTIISGISQVLQLDDRAAEQAADRIRRTHAHVNGRVTPELAAKYFDPSVTDRIVDQRFSGLSQGQNIWIMSNLVYYRVRWEQEIWGGGAGQMAAEGERIYDESLPIARKLQALRDRPESFADLEAFIADGWDPASGRTLVGDVTKMLYRAVLDTPVADDLLPSNWPVLALGFVGKQARARFDLDQLYQDWGGASAYQPTLQELRSRIEAATPEQRFTRLYLAQQERQPA